MHKIDSDQNAKCLATESVDNEGTGFGMRALEILTALAKHKWFIAKFTCIAVAFGVGVSLVLPVKYTATAVIMPPQQTPSASAMWNQSVGSGVGSFAAVSGGLGLRNPNELYLGLLKTQPVADAIIDRFELTQVYHAKDMTAARAALKQNTNILSDQSGLISISVTDRDKERAAKLANQYPIELRLLTQNVAVNEASQRRLFYEGQLKQANEALVEAKFAFEQVQQKKGLFAPDAQARAMVESMASIRAQIAAKKVQLQAIRSYSTEHNPDEQLAEQELTTLQAEASSLAQRHGHPGGFADLSLMEIPSAGLDYLRSEHEYLYRQTLYDLLIKQYDVARLDEAKESAIIQVVVPAIPPERKSSPDRGSIVLMFAALGFVSSSLYLYLGKLIRVNSSASIKLSQLRSALLHK